MKEGMSGYLGTMTATGPGFSFQVFGSKGWVRLEGMTHVAGASSEERRMRLFGTCKFQPIKGEAEVWQAEKLDVGRASLEAFARAASGGPAYPIPLDQMVHGAAVTEAIVRSRQRRKNRKSPVTQFERKTHNGSRRRPRPSHLFHTRASRRQLGRHVDESHDLCPAGEETLRAERPVRRVAAAVGEIGARRWSRASPSATS